ncbi:MAG: hypothetical protein NC400_05740 [Clostridium sp.]|nr:hypothetical protein [Clostridium sp.]
MEKRPIAVAKLFPAGATPFFEKRLAKNTQKPQDNHTQNTNSPVTIKPSPAEELFSLKREFNLKGWFL